MPKLRRNLETCFPTSDKVSLPFCPESRSPLPWPDVIPTTCGILIPPSSIDTHVGFQSPGDFPVQICLGHFALDIRWCLERHIPGWRAALLRKSTQVTRFMSIRDARTFLFVPLHVVSLLPKDFALGRAFHTLLFFSG